MTIKTAICKTSDGIEVPVHCKLWENWHGATNIQKTREQLAADHPDLTFDGWVYDLNSDGDLQSLRLAFLSPNVFAVTKWLSTELGFEKKRITREMVA